MADITAQELKFRIDSAERLNLIDVREPYENAEFNIGGTLVPLEKIQTMQVEEIGHLKNEEVILYCRTGNRSGQAALMLLNNGFADVKHLVGGILAWKDSFGG